MEAREIIQELYSDKSSFNRLALKVFNYQYIHCPVYTRYIDLLNINPEKVKSLSDIPFLPVTFFKQTIVLDKNFPSNKINHVFKSSGTTGVNSSHYIANIALYEKSFMQSFSFFYGDITQYTLLALLPSYSNNENSSLIYMTRTLIDKTNNPDSGFYNNNFSALLGKIKHLAASEKKILLLGVSYALIDFSEYVSSQNENTAGLFKNCIIMETGGMKGKRKEMIKEELHRLLCNNFCVEQIHSEYGMTELLSQSYSQKNGIFRCPPQMKILIRDPEDPFTLIEKNKTGGINIIDLANLHSCSFIATQDLGKLHSDESFEVLGRFDHSDIRGCNLLAD